MFRAQIDMREPKPLNLWGLYVGDIDAYNIIMCKIWRIFVKSTKKKKNNNSYKDFIIETYM